MTRTKKTGLLVTLLIALIALVAAAFTVPGIANAASEANVNRFVGYMQPYAYLDTVEDDTNYKAALYADYAGDTEHENAGKFDAKDLWLSYAAAKSLVAGNILTSEDITDLSTNHKAEYERYLKMDAIYANVYNLSLTYNEMLRHIVQPDAEHPADYGDKDKLAAWVTTNVDSLDDNTEEAMFKVIADSDEEAQRVLTARKALLDQVNAEILKIEYYVDSATGADQSKMQKGVTSGKIVLASGTTVEAVDAKIKALGLTLQQGDTKAIEKWSDYQTALTAYNALTKSIADAQKAIDTVLGKVVLTEGEEVYYTLKEEANKAKEAYEALKAESGKYMGNDAYTVDGETPEKGKDFNNLIEGITKYENAKNTGKYEDNSYEEGDLDPQNYLLDLLEYIEKVDAQIGVIEGKIGSLPGQSYDYGTKDGYVESVRAIEEDIKKLPNDLKVHEEGLYTQKPEPASVGYSIEGYDTYRKALDYVNAKDAEVKAIEEDIDGLIADYFNATGEGARPRADVQGDVVDMENTIKGLEAGQRTQLNTETTTYGEKTLSYSQAVTTMKGDILANYQKVNGIVEEIRALHGDYNYEDRDTFRTLYEKYDQLTDELKTYVENVDLLNEMKGQYDAADAAVKEWLDAVAKVTAEEKLVRITVDNMGDVETATEKWEALADDDTLHFTDIQTVIEGTGDPGKPTTEETAAKTIYDGAVAALGALNTALTNFANKVNASDFSVEPIEDPTQVPAWTEKYKEIDGLHNKLLAVNGTSDTDYYAGNDKYFSGAIATSNEGKTWTKYQKAVELSKQYLVETAIYDIYEAEKADYSAYEEHEFKLSDAEKVIAAREALDNYVKDGGQEKTIRNVDMLTFAEGKMAELTQQLNEWVLKVVKVYNLDYVADQIEVGGKQYIDGTKLSAYVDTIMVSKDYKGYGLNLAYLGSYIDIAYPGAEDVYKVDGEETSLTAQYEALIAAVDGAATNTYVLKGKALLDWYKTTWDTECGRINGEITTLIAAAKAGTLTETNVEEVNSIVDIYENKLHATQIGQIESWEDFQAARDMLVASEDFGALVDALVSGETEYTALTPYYIAVAKSIYSSLDSAHRNIYKTKYDELIKYEEAYKKAVEALEPGQTYPNVAGLSKDLEALTELVDKYIGEDGNGELKTAIETAYKAAIDAAKTELQGKIDALTNGDVKANKDAIAALQQALTALETKTGEDLEAAIAALETKITKAYGDAIEAAKTELKGLIDGLENGQVTTNKNDIAQLQSDLAALQTKTGEDLEAAIAALETKITAAYTTAIQTAIDGLKNGDVKANADAIAALEAALAALETKTGSDLTAAIAALRTEVTEAYTQAIEETKTELQGNLDSLKGNVTALMVVLIIVGVITVALVVCVVLLFIKRKAD